MKSFEWECGQMTVRVDGVPESIEPEALHVFVSVFPRSGSEAVPRFVETVEALGGPEVFGITSGETTEDSVRRSERVDDARFGAALYLPVEGREAPHARPHRALREALERADALAEPRR